MDVGDPSNFKRILELTTSDRFSFEISELISATSVDESETKQAIAQYYYRYGYTLDPHTAVGAVALERYIKSAKGRDSRHHKRILVATAHPAKFPQVVADVIGNEPTAPEQLITNESMKEIYVKLAGDDYNSLRDILLSTS
jgi:threonine synthase